MARPPWITQWPVQWPSRKRKFKHDYNIWIVWHHGSLNFTVNVILNLKHVLVSIKWVEIFRNSQEFPYFEFIWCFKTFLNLYFLDFWKCPNSVLWSHDTSHSSNKKELILGFFREPMVMVHITLILIIVVLLGTTVTLLWTTCYYRNKLTRTTRMYSFLPLSASTPSHDHSTTSDTTLDYTVSSEITPLWSWTIFH